VLKLLTDLDSPEELVGVSLFLAFCIAYGSFQIETPVVWWLASGLSLVVAVCGFVAMEQRGAEADRRDTGKCLHCGYDLTDNVSGVCPECGTVNEDRGAA
jgi:hypothetical protein